MDGVDRADGADKLGEKDQRERREEREEGSGASLNYNTERASIVAAVGARSCSFQSFNWRIDITFGRLITVASIHVFIPGSTKYGIHDDITYGDVYLHHRHGMG